MNKDGFITPNEVTVDPNVSFTGYSQPRDLVSISNGFDLFDRKVRINSLFDYKGGYYVLDNTNSFVCNQAPFAQLPRKPGPHGAALGTGAQRGEQQRHDGQRRHENQGPPWATA